MKHRIVISFSGRRDLLLAHKLRKYIRFALAEQHVDFPCEINVFVTDDDTIQALNKGGRGIDRSTDVLSFMINIYLHTDHDDYIRCICHSADDIQTDLATFPFENMRLVQTVKEVQSSLYQ